MDSIKCYDASGQQIKHLYQWDTGQIVSIPDIDTNTKIEVQFCSVDSKEALVVEHRVEGSNISACIPDILLQRAVPVIVYICECGDDGAMRTIAAVRIVVVPKAKPSDYVYTESETLNYRTLNTKMLELLDSLTTLEGRIPDTLPNPYPLTINGEQYDGSNPVSIDIAPGEGSGSGGNVTIYVQPDEPIDAPVGSIWIDTDEQTAGDGGGSGSGGTTVEETDPTVPEWAKQPNKPIYTAAEVGAATPEDIANALANLPTGSGKEPMKVLYDNTVEGVAILQDTVKGLKDCSEIYFEIMIVNTDATSRQAFFWLGDILTFSYIDMKFSSSAYNTVTINGEMKKIGDNRDTIRGWHSPWTVTYPPNAPDNLTGNHGGISKQFSKSGVEMTNNIKLNISQNAMVVDKITLRIWGC